VVTLGAVQYTQRSISTLPRNIIIEFILIYAKQIATCIMLIFLQLWVCMLLHHACAGDVRPFWRQQGTSSTSKAPSLQQVSCFFVGKLLTHCNSYLHYVFASTLHVT